MVEDSLVIEALRDVPWFHGLGSDEAAALLSISETRRLQAGTVVYEEDTPGKHMLIVLEGALAVESKDDAGQPFRIGIIKRGELAGELAVFDPAPRNATVIASTPAVALQISRESLFELRNQHPRLLMAIATVAMQNAMQRIDAVNKRIERELKRSQAPKVVKLKPGQLPPGVRATEATSSDTNHRANLKKIWAKLTRF